MNGRVSQPDDEQVEVPDTLNRDAFLKALVHHIDDVAAMKLHELPAPRVLAVDAPWGFGKSWVAEKLYANLKAREGKHSEVLIDAFRYDHHEDVFAVIAAAIMKALNPAAEQRKKYLKASGEVLKQVAPIAVKAVANLALKATGLDADDVSDSIKDATARVVDSSGKFSEKQVERLFDRYTKTQQTQHEFQATLGELTIKLDKPFVVIIDELDRCKPTFALEVLERIKHLFSAPNVVFVLFWNSQSLLESIKHTYGRNTDASSYLSKFVALSIALTLPIRRDIGPGSAYGNFISQEMQRVNVRSNVAFEYAEALAEVAGAFNASLRDVQKAIQLFKKCAARRRDGYTTELAYLTLLKVTNTPIYRRIINRDRSAAEAELERFPRPLTVQQSNGPLADLWAELTAMIKPHFIDPNNEEAKSAGSEANTVAQILGIGRPGGKREYLWRCGNELENALSTAVG